MQTFLPYPDYRHSALCLDNKRLGKQRVEVWQIYRALTGESSGWRNHPATKMWQGYERELLSYGLHCCDVWIDKGYKDTIRDQLIARLNDFPFTRRPWWIDETDLCLSHRSNLLRKMPDYYRVFWPNDPDDLPYVWPSKLAQAA